MIFGSHHFSWVYFKPQVEVKSMYLSYTLLDNVCSAKQVKQFNTIFPCELKRLSEYMHSKI